MPCPLALPLAILLAAPAVDGPARPLPASAHNCYPADGRGNAPLVEALALGIDNIEIDLGWDAAAGRVIVGHDAEPRAGRTYPEFEAYLVPALEAHRKAGRPDGAPTVLTLDWKTERPEAVARVRDFLDAHADWFSSAPKAAESPLTRRALTVCFTGSEKAKAIYDGMIPAGGAYRAFADRVFGAGERREDPGDYAPEPADAYRRFLTLHWANVERGAFANAGDWTVEEDERLRSIVRAIHAKGYRVRFYCLDGRPRPTSLAYLFPDPDAARVRWRAAAEAGVDWVATDDYAEIAEAIRGPSGPR